VPEEQEDCGDQVPASRFPPEDEVDDIEGQATDVVPQTRRGRERVADQGHATIMTVEVLAKAMNQASGGRPRVHEHCSSSPPKSIGLETRRFENLRNAEPGGSWVALPNRIRMSQGSERRPDAQLFEHVIARSDVESGNPALRIIQVAEQWRRGMPREPE